MQENQQPPTNPIDKLEAAVSQRLVAVTQKRARREQAALDCATEQDWKGSIDAACDVRSFRSEENALTQVISFIRSERTLALAQAKIELEQAEKALEGERFTVSDLSSVPSGDPEVLDMQVKEDLVTGDCEASPR